MTVYHLDVVLLEYGAIHVEAKESGIDEYCWIRCR